MDMECAKEIRLRRVLHILLYDLPLETITLKILMLMKGEVLGHLTQLWLSKAMLISQMNNKEVHL